MTDEESKKQRPPTRQVFRNMIVCLKIIRDDNTQYFTGATIYAGHPDKFNSVKGAGNILGNLARRRLIEDVGTFTYRLTPQGEQWVENIPETLDDSAISVLYNSTYNLRPRAVRTDKTPATPNKALEDLNKRIEKQQQCLLHIQADITKILHEFDLPGTMTEHYIIFEESEVRALIKLLGFNHAARDCERKDLSRTLHESIEYVKHRERRLERELAREQQ